MSPTVAMILTPAVGTYAFRLIGPVPPGRVEIPPRVQEVLPAGAVVPLVGLGAAATAVLRAARGRLGVSGGR